MRKKMIKREATWRADCNRQVRILWVAEIRPAAALVALVDLDEGRLHGRQSAQCYKPLL
jgi:hypothetical protein